MIFMTCLHVHNMAARRFFVGRSSMYDHPMLRSRKSLFVRRVSISPQPETRGSKWLTKTLFGTVTVIGGSVLVLEYLPGAQESIDHHFPGFIGDYGRAKRQVAQWYYKAYEYVSGAGGQVDKKSEAPFEPQKRKSSGMPQAKELSSQQHEKPKDQPKPSQPKPSTATPKPENKSRKEPQGTTKKHEGSEQKKAMQSSPETKESKPEKTEKSATSKPQVKVKANTIAPPPVAPTQQQESPDNNMDRGDKDSQALQEQRAHEQQLLDIIKAYSSVAESTIRSHDLFAQTVDSLTKGLNHAMEKSGNVEEASIALAAAKEQTNHVQNDCEEATKSYDKALSKLKLAIQSALSRNLQEQASKAENVLKALDAKVKESKEAASAVLGGLSPHFSRLEEKILEMQQKVDKKELSSSVDDVEQLQAMLVVSQEQIEAMKKRMEELESRDQEMISEMVKQQEEDIASIVEERVAAALEKEQQNQNENLKKQAEELEKFYEQKLREQIKRQLVLQEEELQGALKQQHDQLGKEYSEKFQSDLREVTDRHQVELARSMAHLQAVDGMIDAISNAEKEVKKQQGLRAACETLSKAFQVADRNEGAELCSLGREFSSLKEAARHDTFILAVISGVPDGILSGREIASLHSLYRRFDKVQKVCHRVALVPEHGGLGTYLVSAIASVFTFNVLPFNTIDKDTPLEELDTYEILHQAEAYINHGDLEMATRCLNHLQGEPRRVAKDWLKDARLYLEVKQAATVITEYIAASSVSLS